MMQGSKDLALVALCSTDCVLFYLYSVIGAGIDNDESCLLSQLGLEPMMQRYLDYHL